MKSDEEFIAGIYEKAATYMEQNKQIETMAKAKPPIYLRPAFQMAAMFVVCLGVLGATLALRGGQSATPDLPSVASGQQGVVPFSMGRMLPETEQIQLQGVVTEVTADEGILWVSTEDAAFADTDRVAVAYLATEESLAPAQVGDTVLVFGIKDEYNGKPMIITETVSDIWIYLEEENVYRNCDGEERTLEE